MSQIREIPAGKVIGIKTSFFTIMNAEKYDAKVIPSAWQSFFAQYHSSALPRRNAFYGAVVPSESIDVPMTYVAGVLVDSNTEVPEGFASVDIPAGKYFCAKHLGPMVNLAPSYGNAYGVEFPASGLDMRPAPHLEIYESDKEPMDSDYEFIIAIPVN